MNHIFKPFSVLIASALIITSCTSKTEKAAETETAETMQEEAPKPANNLTIELENHKAISDEAVATKTETGISTNGQGWVSFDAAFATAGRYRVEVVGSSETSGKVWVEDYIDNKDGRTYNVTGSLVVDGPESMAYKVEGSPFNALNHQMKLHFEGAMELDKLVFTLIKKHQETPEVLTQNMEGTEWELVWSDEFDGETLDTSKWIYDFGDWGWGNNELQYYTDARTENTRVEDGNLVIEARKDDMGEAWTSSRLTTRGKVTFLYGKIEFKALIPREKGNWAAGWTLGDSYVDELSWPYCGEIDIMESVGYEVDDETGNGIAHATVHTPAYYFKINNQISSTKEVANIANEFHTYGVEWTPTEVRGYVDGEQYYVYDKNANDMEWPFNQPQNIILNLAMGGGWGGAMGMDTTVTSQVLLIDYVRVYGMK